MHFLEQVALKRLNALVRLSTLLVFAVMVLAVMGQVVFRYVLRISVPWSEELARFLFIWATFLGASIAFCEGGHINVSFFVGRIRNIRAQALVRLTAYAFCLWFLGMYVWDGFILCNRLIAMGQTSPAIPRLLMGVVYLAIPIGSLLMICNILPHVARCLLAVHTGKQDGG